VLLTIIVAANCEVFGGGSVSLNDNAKIDSRQATQMITYKLNHVSSPLAMKPERPNSIWRGDQLGRGADKANPAAKLEASRRIIATRHAFNI